MRGGYGRTWTMREAFHAVSPCRTTTSSVDNSSPAPAPDAGVSDMARSVGARLLVGCSGPSPPYLYIERDASGVNASFQEAGPAPAFSWDAAVCQVWTETEREGFTTSGI
jgi:hypothetical protein